MKVKCGVKYLKGVKQPSLILNRPERNREGKTVTLYIKTLVICVT